MDDNNEKAAPSVVACEKCNVQLVTKEKKSSVSIAGIFSVLMFLVGALVMLANVMVGIIVMVVAIIIGSVGRGTKTVMVCPQCGAEGRTI